MTLANPRRSNRRLTASLGACLAVMIVAAAVVVGCGGSSKAATTSSGRTVQVLATVRRGDLVESVIGRVRLTLTKGKATGVVQVTGQHASQIAAGQSVTLTFFQLPSGAGQGGFGQGSPRPSVTPSAGSGGQGSFGQGGQGAFRGGKTAQGTVASVQPGSNGSVTATIAIVKLPSGVTAKYTGTAQIQVKVLASNVLVIPRAAIKGGGGNATVQVLVNGKTSTRSVTVGQQTQTDSEITSGLSAGDSIVYTRTFTGRFPGSGNGQSGGQGFPQNGTPPSGVPSGAPFGASQPGP